MSNVNLNAVAQSYNVSPQLVQQVAKALSGGDLKSLNAALKGGNFSAGGGGGINTGIDTGSMAQAFPAQAPQANLQATQTFDLHAIGKNAQKSAKAGYPQTGLSGALVEEGVGKSKFWHGNKAAAFEKKLKSNPEFRKKIEKRLNAKFIPDSSNDGKVAFAPLTATVPGVQPNAGQVMNTYGAQTGGNAMAGMQQMHGNAAQLLLALGQNPAMAHMNLAGPMVATGGAAALGVGAAGAGALAIGGEGGGVLKNGALGLISGLSGNGMFNPMGMAGAEWKMRSMFGMTKSQGGPGSRVASLPAGASFEDIVAAFMTDVIDDMQKEAMAKMNQIRKSINSQNSLMGKAKRALGGVASVAGTVGGFMVGGPVGAMVGGAAGGAVGGIVGGNPGSDADSRNLMFEELKNIMQKLQQMLQALSNVINTMHQGAMNSIRNIRA